VFIGSAAPGERKRSKPIRGRNPVSAFIQSLTHLPQGFIAGLADDLQHGSGAVMHDFAAIQNFEPTAVMWAIPNHGI
jgi:hypothetical protein